MSAVSTGSKRHEKEYHKALMERDASFDGRFVYGVASTWIYCRPSCPSRRPAIANVRLFHECEEAEAAGFRVCLRCQPNSGNEWRRDFRMVSAACEALEESASGGRPQQWTLETLGRKAGASAWHLQRTFRRMLGISPKEYENAVRMRAFRAFAKEDGIKVAARKAGLSSSSRLYEVPSQLGMLPTDYKRGGAKLSIVFSTVPCPLGNVLIAATGHGVCAIRLGDNAEEMERELLREFPAAKLSRGSGSLGPFFAAVLGYLLEANPLEHLPLDIQGTAFQQRVWNALNEIPTGETRTYGQLAAQLGAPGAARAVGGACAANPVALAIPCHRAVSPGHKQPRYRWGGDRKLALLAMERERADKTHDRHGNRPTRSEKRK